MKIHLEKKMYLNVSGSLKCTLASFFCLSEQANTNRQLSDS